MKIGFIGLGKMGQMMVLHLLEEGVDVVVYNRSSAKTDELNSKFKIQKAKVKNVQKAGELIGSYSVDELISQLESPRIIWLMVPEGAPVDEMIQSLRTSGIKRGDVIIDGGNSFYQDSVKRARNLEKSGIYYLDVGTSGGLEGAREGACLMIGGDKKITNSLNPLFQAMIGQKGGYAYFGPSGAGHFVKMVHNGVEYGMLQAIGEGFEILKKGPYKLDLHLVAGNWNKGSVVRGWLMELLEKAFKTDNNLSSIKGVIGGGKTGAWALDTANKLGVNTPVLKNSIKIRKNSTLKPSFSGKVVSALRNQFGGHKMEKDNG